MMATVARSDTLRDYTRRVLRVLVHIQEHLDEELSLDELAAVACFSPFHFHRVFRGLVGESVKQHVKRLRLERAAHHLRHTGRPVISIALDAGYAAHEAFTRAFHAAFGCSPTTYRGGSDASGHPDGAASAHFAAGGGGVRFRPLTLEDEPMKVTTRTIDPMRVAFLRHVGPYDEVGETWEQLMDWVGAECLFGPDTLLFGACWDDPEVTRADRIRYDACVSLPESVTPTGEIGLQTLGGGRFAVVLHEGPYDRLGETYAGLFGRWLPASGLEPGDPPSLELYLNDPNSTDPGDLLTEVCVRIRE